MKNVFKKEEPNNSFRHGIIDVIKYEGDNSTFVWKHPSEDFNMNSQLIVHESQEALFMSNGQALDLFGPGRYTLDTQNIPIIGKLFNKVAGDQSPFHCEVYFINKTIQMGVKWGVDSKVRYVDPETNVPIELGVFGEMNLQVTDSRKLLVKLVGTMNGIAWESNNDSFTKSLRDSFRPLISTEVKTHLIQTIKEQGFDILDIDEHYGEISQSLKEKINPGFEEYGLSIPQFYILNVTFPEEDENFQIIRNLHSVSIKTKNIEAEATIKSAQAQADASVLAAERQAELERQTTQTEIARMEAERKRINAMAQADELRANGLAEAEIMRAKGYSEKDVLMADVQKAYAEGIGNVGANGGGSGGSVVSDMIGLGVGLQAAGAMGSQLKGFFNDINGANIEPKASDEFVICDKCGNRISSILKFCPECGNKMQKTELIICPGCGKEIPKSKFCPECGYKFINKCPNCGSEVATGVKFCPECGNKL